MSDEAGRPRPDEGWAYVVSAAPPSLPAGWAPPPSVVGPTRVRDSRRTTIVLGIVAALSVSVMGTTVVRAVHARSVSQSLGTELRSGGVEGEPGATYSYAWVNPDGSAVRWNPCRPIRWVVNPAGAPPGAIDDLTAAVRRVGDATGITFVYGGEVTEAPSPNRPAVQPDRYGDDWAPVLISWARLQGTALGAGLGTERETVGVATPVAISQSGDSGVLVTGQIVLESSVVVSPGFRTTKSQGAVMLHELSHILGLGHTPDNAQLLYEGGEPIAGTGELGPGDRAGLASVGRSAGCLQTPRPEDVD